MAEIKHWPLPHTGTRHIAIALPLHPLVPLMPADSDISSLNMSARAQMAKFKTQAESRNRDVRALRSEDGTWQIRVRNTDQFSPESDVISTLDTDDKYLVIPMGMIPPDVPCLIKMETVPFGWRSGVDEDNLNNASVDIRCLQAIRFDSQTVVLNPSSPVNSSVSSRTKVIVTDSDVWKMTIGHWATKAWLNGFSWGSNTDQDTIRCGEAAMKHGVSDLLTQLNSWKNDTRLTDVRIRFAAGTLTLSTGQKAVHAGWQLDGIPSTVPPSYSGDYPTAIIPLQALPSQRPHVPAEALGIQLNYEAHPTQSHTFNAPYHKRYYISRPSTGANTASVWAVSIRSRCGAYRLKRGFTMNTALLTF